jgi:DNA-binding GntR family transcriptional regulator
MTLALDPAAPSAPSPTLTSGPEDAGGSSSTLSTALVKRLRQAILTGELKPGSKLRLEALREKLGVTQSRSPLREALSRLGAEGLVLIEDQRGYRVAPVSQRDLREIGKLRSNFETLALREAIAHGDAAWESDVRASLQSLLATRRSDHMTPEGQEGWETGHRSFHLSLLQACDMPMLLRYCSNLHDQNDRYRRMFLQSHPFDRDVSAEHRAIVEATLERNADLACALLSQHIARTNRNIAAALAIDDAYGQT